MIRLGDAPVLDESRPPRIVSLRAAMNAYQNAQTRHERLMGLKADFDRTHVSGMAALNAGDYEGFGAAIAREREIIQQQSSLLSEGRAYLDRERPRYSSS